MFKFSLLAVTVLAVSAAGLSLSATRADEAGLDSATRQAAVLLLRNVRPNQTVVVIRERMMQIFNAEDLDGGGISESDTRFRERQAAAEFRANKLKEALRHDLDGDGAVTMEELRRSLLPEARRPPRSAAAELPPTPEQVAQTLDRLVREAGLPDPDGDGRASIAEILAAASAEFAAKGRPAGHRQIGEAYDLDDDDVITHDEFAMALDAAMADLDPDGDGQVSAAETKAFRDAVSAVQRQAARREQQQALRARIRAKAENCPIPPVPAEADFVFLGMREAGTKSRVWLDDRRKFTYLADIRIEPGSRPVYLVAAAEKRMILRFSGHVDRLAQVFNIGQETMGFVGIARDRAGWFERGGCGVGQWDVKLGDTNTKVTQDYIEALAGRPLDKAVADGRIGMVSLPSGEKVTGPSVPRDSERRETETGPTWKRVPSREPQGLLPVTLDSVIAPDRALAVERGN